MTPKLSNLSDDQLRVMVAEACGWRFHPSFDGHTGNAFPESWTHDEHERVWDSRDLPDCLNSRDLCAQFEHTMSDDEGSEYIWFLAKLCGVSDLHEHWDNLEVFRTAKANPHQRVCAFLLAKGRVTA